MNRWPCSSPTRRHCRAGSRTPGSSLYETCDRANRWHHWILRDGTDFYVDHRLYRYQAMLRCLLGLSWRQQREACS